MKRKIIRQGHNTLTVSLPRKWCDTHQLKEGNEIELDEKGNCLLLSKEAFKGAGNVSVDVSGLDRSTIILLMQSLYTYGYDAITINTSDKKARRYLSGKEISFPSIINYVVGTLIGAELVSSMGKSYKIEVIAGDSKEKFDTVLRRIFLLINEMFEMFNEGIKNKDKALLESMPFKHMNVKRFVNYAQRLLNKFGHEEADKTTFYFSIISFLGKIIEIIKNYTGYIVTEGVFLINKRISSNLSKKAGNFIEEIGEMFNVYGELFYKYDLKKISDIHKKRDLFKKRFYEEYNKLNKGDLFVVTGLMPIADIMLDLIELRMAIGYKD